MVSARTVLVLAMAAVAVVGMVTPAVAGSALPLDAATPNAESAAASNHTAGAVDVGVGQQLSTIITATEDDTLTEFEDASFEFEFEGANESERAEAIADRAVAIRERAEAIREDYRAATEAYEAGELTREEYAQRIATLNARATNVLASVEALQAHAANVSTLELRVAGVNRSRLEATVGALEDVTGVGPAALLARFTGASSGAVEIETTDGLEIEVESEDGERSLEIKRPRDDDRNLTVNGSVALETARDALSSQAAPWVLEKASVHPEEGYYAFEFGFRSANETGEAEVRVDGSSGAVFRLEEEIEPLDDDDDLVERDDEDEDADEEDDEDDAEGDDGDDDGDEVDDVAVVLVEGTPAPGATVTVQVLADGAPVNDTTVSLNGESVGTTDASGRLTLTLPDGEVTISARYGGEDGDLEFEFEDDEVFRQLDVAVAIDNGTATVTVTYDGTGVQDATVYANDELVGTTSANGTVAFAVPADTDELELELVKGEFEAELEFELTDDGARLTTEVHEGDGDKVDDDDADEEEDETDEADDDEGDEDETADDDDADDSSGSDDDDDADDSSGSGSGDDDADDEEDSSGSG